MKIHMKRRTYLFVDESGNLDFTGNGTRYFVLTSVRLTRPFPLNKELDSYKDGCLVRGINIESFHCKNDRKRICFDILDQIASVKESIRVHCRVIMKRKDEQDSKFYRVFYQEMLRALLTQLLLTVSKNGVQEVIVITGTIPVRR